ncbi:MAG: hypothetical protein JXA96_08305 [Sedimentisphaerales bacterium]|nr:hypothetical protein [Sedimentisphaerales bacterium]
MSEQIKLQAESQNMQKKKSSLRRYRLFAVILVTGIVAGYIYSVAAWKSESQKVSEKLIRKAAAYQLNKKPDDLTDEDFAKVTTLIIENYDTTELLQKKVELYDITFLEKFVNLQELDISNITLPKPDIPKWMVILAKLHVFDLYKKYHKHYMNKYLIDLSPLENLSHLEVIRLFDTAVKNLKPLTKLDNLQEIHLCENQLADLGLIKTGVIPKTLSINDRDFILELGYGNVIWTKKYIESKPEFSNKSLPIIFYYISGVYLSPLHNAETEINVEVHKALK